MKKRFIAFLAFVSSLALAVGPLAAREFTEKSGGRTLTGEVTQFDAANNTVTIRLENNRTVTFDPTILMAKDVEYIERWARNQALASRIDISANRESGERIGPETRGPYQYRYDQSAFRVSLRNRAQTGTLKSVPVKWHVVITRSGDRAEVVSGTHTFETIHAGETVEFTTDMVRLTTACRSMSSCPKCVRFAAAFTSDRIEGVLVEILDSDGEVITDVISPSSRERRIREALQPESAAGERS